MSEQNKKQYNNNNYKRRKKRYDKNRYNNDQKPKKKREYAMVKKCAHCGSPMKPRGSVGVVGALSWKCRNKKCGRTIKEFKKVKPPEPLVPVSVLDLRNV